jgi:hypothetical protein
LSAGDHAASVEIACSTVLPTETVPGRRAEADGKRSRRGVLDGTRIPTTYSTTFRSASAAVASVKKAFCTTTRVARAVLQTLGARRSRGHKLRPALLALHLDLSCDAVAASRRDHM